MKLEVCVETISGAMAAKRGGAHRLELCAALSEGGITPSVGLMAEVAALDIPTMVMIRPRAGHFYFDAAEMRVMQRDIDAARDAGLTGVVIGVQREDGTLDGERLAQLVDAADGLEVTLHRVIDLVPDRLAALDIAIDLGIARVLTSGGASDAPAGAKAIAEMVDHAAGRITVMPGGGVTPDNVAALVRETEVSEVHGSCSEASSSSLPGFDPAGGMRMTSESRVRAMLASLGLGNVPSGS
ncbi:copper homeostasis protein CutC [Pelagovum pacificum]|uniref:PF03932 family protein CutC n=1 Tax=Pelagovum pacificum TaxID=2588711 RepID=A0A5C5G9Q2_9RHOB|nr:copper homeostasis protein CutC [Pelagovum pacificum]QQA42216.1 copper homeostasis protein CutC [Pelagovum pacificum]TNY31303.1 copper homeostasis protein CutC [Pelagovum pacificum]